MTGLWTEEADRRLWAARHRPTSQLAAEFDRGPGAIRSRLKHLQDPTHKAYLRLHGGGTGGTGRGGYGSAAATAARAAAPAYAAAASASRAGGYGSSYSQSNPTRSHHVPAEQPPQQRIDPSTLNDGQREASSYILSGGNAFLTGAAGVGKSYLLKYIIQGLRDKYEAGGNATPNDRVVVAASTGIAATHINGVTIHSWAGVRLGKGGASVLVPRVMQNESAIRRWRRAQVLVLDEVSMLDGVFFEALNAIAQTARGCPHLPFGGIQLVLSGDFFQLPPVSLNQGGFAFEAPAWTQASVRMLELRTVVRQSGDQTFINILNQIRIGQCSHEISNILDACHISKKLKPVDGIVPTKLYCTNRNVDQENNRKLDELPGNGVTFAAIDEFKDRYYPRDAQKRITQAMDRKSPSQLTLKVGAQVIVTRNMPDYNLVNGSRGTVKSFEWATVNNNDADARTGAGQRRQYPVVHFTNGVRLRITEENTFQGGSDGTMVRYQLPLKLAWSLTVHKSQGMTIDRAELQLDDAFEVGQVYVALSRVTSLEGLWVRGGRITQSVVKAHPKVKAFYQLVASTS